MGTWIRRVVRSHFLSDGAMYHISVYHIYRYWWFPAHLRAEEAKVNKNCDLPKLWSVADLESAGKFLLSRLRWEFGNIYV